MERKRAGTNLALSADVKNVLSFLECTLVATEVRQLTKPACLEFEGETNKRVATIASRV